VTLPHINAIIFLQTIKLNLIFNSGCIRFFPRKLNTDVIFIRPFGIQTISTCNENSIYKKRKTIVLLLVPGTGIEPVRHRCHRILSPAYFDEIFVFSKNTGCKSVQKYTKPHLNSAPDRTVNFSFSLPPLRL
jgi:hypothetical protein